MTSREIVLAAFDHRPTPRAGKWFGSSPAFIECAVGALGLPDEEALRRRVGDDFRRVTSRWAGPTPELSPGATWISPFGVERTGLFYGEPTSHPLAGASKPADLDRWAWPDPEWADVSGIEAQAAAFERTYAILGGEWSPFFHDAIDLVGMEKLYYLMYDNPGLVDELLSRINRYYLEATRRAFEADGGLIDIHFIGNDFGGQTGPLLGPHLFDRFMKPHLAAHATLAHRYGKKLMLHCCGGFRPLIRSIAEAGVDALHALQPDCTGMDPDALKNDFGADLVLCGGLDSRAVLIHGTEREVRDKTHELLETMTQGGGYIAGASHDYILPETPVQNVIAMFDTIMEYRCR